MQGMSENKLRLGIIVTSGNESHLKIARNIVRLTNAMICESICNPDILIAVDSTLPYLPSLSMGKLGGAINRSFYT
jgi:hypothetical protein